MSGLRIIAGEYRGRVVPSPVDPGSRPLLARIRQSLCDSLQAAITDAGVLDLFAGSGVVGLELLSRGAAAAVFVDSSPRAAQKIGETLALFHVEQRRAVALAGDALRPERWARPDLPGAPWSLVFVGTPYRLGATPEGRHRLVEALEALRQGGYLAPDALAVMQFEPGSEIPIPADGWTEDTARRRIFGRTGLAFWRAQLP